jgi:hypothetical protein
MYNVTLENWEQQCFEYLMKEENIQGWIENFVKERARKAYESIVPDLVKYCNENSIPLAVGKEAQMQQAFDLGVIKMASQRDAEAAQPE